jgi:Peptidase family S41
MRFRIDLALACFVACVTLASVSSPDACAEARYTPRQLLQDLSAMNAAIANTHPDAGHSVDPEALSLATLSLGRRMNRAMSRDEAWREFASLNPLLADGHLNVILPDWRGDTRTHLDAGGVLFPFEVHVTPEGNLLITAQLGGAASRHSGARLISINGRSSRQVVKDLLARVHGDTPAFRAALLSQRWWLYYWRMYGAPERFDIELSTDRHASLSIRGRNATPAVLAHENDFDHAFRFELLAGHSALLTINTFAWPDKQRFLTFTEQSFAAIRRAGVRSLIIDIRNNLGGDDDMWIQGVMPYIATQRYRWASSYRKKVLEGHQDEGQTIGDVITGQVERWIEPQLDHPLRYSGKTYILIGALTYSSAVLFTQVIQDFSFGTIAGEGGVSRAKQSGGIQTTTLPHTGLVLTAPRFILTRPSAQSSPMLMQPDISLHSDPLQPRAMVDALLQIALDE